MRHAVKLLDLARPSTSCLSAASCLPRPLKPVHPRRREVEARSLNVGRREPQILCGYRGAGGRAAAPVILSSLTTIPPGKLEDLSHPRLSSSLSQPARHGEDAPLDHLSVVCRVLVRDALNSSGGRPPLPALSLTRLVSLPLLPPFRPAPPLSLRGGLGLRRRCAQ